MVSLNHGYGIKYIMTSFIICKNCKNKIHSQRPGGSVRIQGNVTYGDGVKFSDNNVVIGPGGGMTIGPGGSVSIGGSPNSRITCPTCGKTYDYSATEFLDE